VGGDAAKARLARADAGGNWSKPPPGCISCSRTASEQAVKDEGVGVLQLQPAQRRLDLRRNRVEQVVDLGDDEEPVAHAFDRLPDDLLGVAVLVAGRGVDHIQPGVDGAAQRGDARWQRHAAVGQVAGAEHAGDEAGAAQLAARLKTSCVRHSTLLRFGLAANYDPLS
jgi:hypothetical protein